MNLKKCLWNKDRVNADDIPYQLKEKWHDLRKNPRDVPEKDASDISALVLVFYDYKNYKLAYFANEEWIDDKGYKVNDLIGWMPIPKFFTI